MSQSSRSGGRFRSCGCLIGALGLLAVLVIGGGAAWLYWGPQPESTLPPLVSLRVASGSVAFVERPVITLSSAAFDNGIDTLELYADGALVATQNTTLQGGSNPLVLTNTWSPLTPGRHVLMARAYASDGTIADSDVQYVNVIELPPTLQVNVDEIQRGEGAPPISLDVVAVLAGTSTEQVLTLNPTLAGVAPSVPLPPGTVITIPRPPAPPPVSGGGAPAGGGSGSGSGGGASDGGGAGSGSGGGAPAGGGSGGAGGAPRPRVVVTAPTNLNVTADCANATLTWADSPDEESYKLYVLRPGDRALQLQSTLPANTTSTTMPLVDLGEYRFQVAAVKRNADLPSDNEALTPMFLVRTPGDCALLAPPPVGTELALRLIEVETSKKFDGVYCYLSVNDVPFVRLPIDGFVPSVPGNRKLFRLGVLAEPAQGRMLIIQPGGVPLTMAIECVGDRGIEVLRIGASRFSHTPEEWDGSERQVSSDGTGDAGAGNFLLKYCIGPADLACRPGPELLDLYIATEFSEIAVSPISSGGVPLPEFILDPLTNLTPSLPAPRNLTMRLDRTLCGSSEFLRCELEGLPTLFWDWTPASGFSAERTRFIVTGEAIDPSTGEHLRDLNSLFSATTDKYLWLNIFSMLSIPCNESWRLQVVAFNDSRQSWPSDPLTIPARTCPAPNRVEVTIDFLSLTLSYDVAGGYNDVSDINGDFCLLCTDRRFEYSGIFVATPSDFLLETASEGGGVFSPCPRTTACLDVPAPHQSGIFRLGGAVDTRLINFRDLAIPHDPNSYGPPSNTLIFEVGPRQSFSVSFILREEDGGHVTNECQGFKEWRAFGGTDDEWARIPGEYTLRGGRGPEGVCTLTVRISTTLQH